MSETLLPLVLFVIVAVGTPGPNNAMLLASGANFGVRRALPHYLGVNLGFTAMVFVVAAGLGATLLQFPIFSAVLRFVGITYLLYLAFRIATAETSGTQAGRGQPITFTEAALFQWVNPKAWIMATSASVTYATGHSDPIVQAMVLAAVFLVAGSPFSGIWLVGGAAVSKWLSSSRRRRIFNGAMAGLLVLSVLPILAETIWHG
ncbi:LysE family translocator [Fulvimarina endophytica]|uniref:LysE family translocator n=1 Tax=Fulvimarina endophytica TaxID=2293836 RepID=A0A371X0M5_9HYPH|nr:LysE family translocator [Fulvimarina endophytica]RFC62781.1 LysE family translocator [Fulvimarina endophytica]